MFKRKQLLNYDLFLACAIVVALKADEKQCRKTIDVGFMFVCMVLSALNFYWYICLL